MNRKYKKRTDKYKKNIFRANIILLHDIMNGDIDDWLNKQERRAQH